jgi:DNA repair protein RadC
MKDIQNLDREKFYAIHLDTKNQVIGIDEVSSGTLNQSLLHPREVFKSAILNSAAAIILAHNHPSGDTLPSQDDRITVGRLYQCGELLGIEVFDSLIIGHDCYYSAKESGEF